MTFTTKRRKIIRHETSRWGHTAKLAIQYLVVLRETLGEAWMNADYFRFGASSLANDVLMQIAKLETGVYQGEIIFLILKM